MMGPLDALSLIVGAMGIGGNSVVCFVICRVRHLHTLTNAFIFNQAVADLLCSLVLLLHAILPVPDPFPAGWPGLLLCHAWASQTVLWLFMNTSSIGLAALTLERYLAIVFPFRYRATVTSSRRLPALALASTWIVGFGLGLISSISLVDYSAGEGRCEVATLSPASNPLHGVIFALYVVYFTTTASTMLFAYVHIAVVLNRSAKLQIRPVSLTALRRQSEIESRPAEAREEPLLRARRNVIKTLTLVFAVYMVCWLPNEIMSAVGTSGLALRVSVVLVASNSCFNPLIYAIKYRSFRNGLMQLVRKTRRFWTRGTDGDHSPLGL